MDSYPVKKYEKFEGKFPLLYDTENADSQEPSDEKCAEIRGRCKVHDVKADQKLPESKVLLEAMMYTTFIDIMLRFLGSEDEVVYMREENKVDQYTYFTHGLCGQKGKPGDHKRSSNMSSWGPGHQKRKLTPTSSHTSSNHSQQKNSTGEKRNSLLKNSDSKLVMISASTQAGRALSFSKDNKRKSSTKEDILETVKELNNEQIEELSGSTSSPTSPSKKRSTYHRRNKSTVKYGISSENHELGNAKSEGTGARRSRKLKRSRVSLNGIGNDEAKENESDGESNENENEDEDSVENENE